MPDDKDQNKTKPAKRNGARVRISLDKGDFHRAGEAMEATIINPTLARVLPVLLVLVVIYYVLGMSTTHIIDDDLAYRPDHRTENGYYSVDMAAALINREVDIYGWKANNPFYVPSALLDNMPHFQIGLFSMLHSFVQDLSKTEPDNEHLALATQKLGYDATRWYYQLSDPSAMPQPPAEDEYERARTALLAYNMERVNSDVIWNPTAQDLAGMLETMSRRLGAIADSNRSYMAETSGFLPDVGADDLFYRNKGQLYGCYMILLALSRDYDSLLAANKSLRHGYDAMLDRLGQAVSLSPLIVMNGRQDGMFLPSHLAAQGFSVLDAQRAVHALVATLHDNPAKTGSAGAEPAIETQAGEPQ